MKEAVKLDLPQTFTCEPVCNVSHVDADVWKNTPGVDEASDRGTSGTCVHLKEERETCNLALIL